MVIACRICGKGESDKWGLCRTHRQFLYLWQAVQAGRYSDWGADIMSHADMQTDAGISLQKTEGVWVSDGDMEIALFKLRRRWHFYAATRHTSDGEGEAA